jgi:mannan endo-1,4-beta-mannosidase
MTVPPPEPALPVPSPPRPARRANRWIQIAVVAVVFVSVAILTAGVLRPHPAPPRVAPPSMPGVAPVLGAYATHPVVITLPHRTASYLGVFVRGVPGSYVPLQNFADRTRVQPNIALYYSSWFERFQSVFAVQATDHGAVPQIQIDPSRVRLGQIASGRDDSYLEAFATDVASYGAHTGHGVIISFGHEMNGSWYSWGRGHTSPRLFVAAWRHIVRLFRKEGADDVTWLWTVNIIDKRGGIPSPAPWWPGSSFVTWIGIDGYFLKPSWTFAPLFGPTITAVRALSREPVPILIAETGAAAGADQPGKIADLYAGVRAYGLLGFVWFDARGLQYFRMNDPAALAAYRQGARAYGRPPS